VPPGVKVPVATKRDLKDGTRTAIRLGAVYFRSLRANGTPSTTEAKPNDWAEIVDVCFENREADIGRFLRRQLAGRDLSSLISFLGQPTPQAAPTLCTQATNLIDDGQVRFQGAIQARKLSAEEQQMLDHGFWSVGLVIDPPAMDAIPNQEFLSRINS